MISFYKWKRMCDVADKVQKHPMTIKQNQFYVGFIHSSTQSIGSKQSEDNIMELNT
jgi:hypothetical protein